MLIFLITSRKVGSGRLEIGNQTEQIPPQSGGKSGILKKNIAVAD